MPSPPIAPQAHRGPNNLGAGGVGRVSRIPLPQYGSIPNFQPYWPKSPDGALDYDILADVANRLSASGQFGLVSLNGPIGAAPMSSDNVSIVAIIPSSWDDLDHSSNPIVIDEDGKFTIQLAVRDTDDTARLLLISQLQQIIKSAINGQSLGGLTCPARTLVRRGQYDPKWTPPEQRLAMTAEYSLQAVGYDGFDN